MEKASPCQSAAGNKTLFSSMQQEPACFHLSCPLRDFHLKYLGVLQCFNVPCSGHRVLRVQSSCAQPPGCERGRNVHIWTDCLTTKWEFELAEMVGGVGGGCWSAPFLSSHPSDMCLSSNQCWALGPLPSVLWWELSPGLVPAWLQRIVCPNEMLWQRRGFSAQAGWALSSPSLFKF